MRSSLFRLRGWGHEMFAALIRDFDIHAAQKLKFFKQIHKNDVLNIIGEKILECLRLGWAGEMARNAADEMRGDGPENIRKTITLIETIH